MIEHLLQNQRPRFGGNNGDDLIGVLRQDPRPSKVQEPLSGAEAHIAVLLAHMTDVLFHQRGKGRGLVHPQHLVRQITAKAGCDEVLIPAAPEIPDAMLNDRLLCAADILDKGLGSADGLLELGVAGHQNGVGSGEQRPIHPGGHQHDAGAGHDAVGVEDADGVRQVGVRIIVVRLVAVSGDCHEKEEGVEKAQDVFGLLLLI